MFVLMSILRDRKLTMSQNYKELGLSSRLNAPTGGSEKKPKPNDAVENQEPQQDAFSVPNIRKTTKLVPREAKVERDLETGRILRVVQPLSEDANSIARRMRLNPLNDPLADLEDEEPTAPKAATNGVVAELEAQVEEEAEILAKKRRPRQQSKREEEWLERLVAKYGDDTRAMARDTKLNPMQQSEGDLARRVRKWKSSQPAIG